MRRCTFCQNEVPVAARFCGYCGKALQSSSDITSYSATSLSLLEADKTIISTPPPPPNERGGQYPAGNEFPWGGIEDVPTITVERRTDLLVDAPGIGLLPNSGQISGGNVPMVQGSPQLGGVPTMHGTPSNFSSPQTPPPSPVPHHLLARMPEPTTQPPPLSAHHLRQHQPRSQVQDPATHPEHHEIHHPDQGQQPNPVQHHPRQHAAENEGKAQASHESRRHRSEGTDKNSSSHNAQHHKSRHHIPRLGGGAARWVLLGVVAAVLVATGTIGLVLASPASLSLHGGNSVSSGGTLQVHGSGFLPGRSVGLTLDNGLPVTLASHGTSKKDVPGGGTHAFALSSMQLLQTIAASATVTASSSGTFDVQIRVDKNWPVGAHKLHATQGLKTATLLFTVTAPVVVVSPTETPSPTPTPTATSTTAPTPTPSPTPVPTVVLTPTPTLTHAPTLTPTATSSPTPTPSPSPTPTPTPSPTPTDTPPSFVFGSGTWQDPYGGSSYVGDVVTMQLTVQGSTISGTLAGSEGESTPVHGQDGVLSSFNSNDQQFLNFVIQNYGSQTGIFVVFTIGDQFEGAYQGSTYYGVVEQNGNIEGFWYFPNSNVDAGSVHMNKIS